MIKIRIRRKLNEQRERIRNLPDNLLRGKKTISDDLLDRMGKAGKTISDDLVDQMGNAEKTQADAPAITRRGAKTVPSAPPSAGKPRYAPDPNAKAQEPYQRGQQDRKTMPGAIPKFNDSEHDWASRKQRHAELIANTTADAWSSKRDDPETIEQFKNLIRQTAEKGYDDEQQRMVQLNVPKLTQFMTNIDQHVAKFGETSKSLQQMQGGERINARKKLIADVDNLFKQIDLLPSELGYRNAAEATLKYIQHPTALKDDMSFLMSQAGAGGIVYRDKKEMPPERAQKSSYNQYWKGKK